MYDLFQIEHLIKSNRKWKLVYSFVTIVMQKNIILNLA